MPIATHLHKLPLSISLDYLQKTESELIAFQREMTLSGESAAQSIKWPSAINELITLYRHIKHWMQTKQLKEINLPQLLLSLENTPVELHKHLVLFWAEYFKRMLEYEKNPLNLSSFVSRQIDNPIQFAGFIVYLFTKYNILEISLAGAIQEYFISQCFDSKKTQQTHKLLQELAQKNIYPALKHIHAFHHAGSELPGFETYRLSGEPFDYRLHLVPDNVSTTAFISELLEKTAIITDYYVWDKKNITHIKANKTLISHPLDDVGPINTFLNNCVKNENSQKHVYVKMPYDDFVRCIHKKSPHMVPKPTILPYKIESKLTLSIENITNLFALFGPPIIQVLISMAEQLGENEATQNTFISIFEKISIKEIRDFYANCIREQCYGITVLGRILSLERSCELFELCRQQPHIVSPWMILATSRVLQNNILFVQLKNQLIGLPLTKQCLLGLLSLKEKNRLSLDEEYQYTRRVYHFLIENPKIYSDLDVEFELDSDQPNLFFTFMHEDDFSISEVLCTWLRTSNQSLLIAGTIKMHMLLQELYSRIHASYPFTIYTFDALRNWYHQQKTTVKFLSACHANFADYPKDNYALYSRIILLLSEKNGFDLSSCLDIFCSETAFSTYSNPLLEQRCAQARIMFEYILNNTLGNLNLHKQFFEKLNELIFVQPECLGFDIVPKERINKFLSEMLNQKSPTQLLALIQMCIEKSASEPRAIKALHNIGLLLNETKLEEIIRLKQISIWKLIDCLGYKDLSSIKYKKNIKQLKNRFKNELIDETNYLHILNIIEKTSILEVEEKRTMSRRIFHACVYGYASQNIIEQVVSRLDTSSVSISCYKQGFYQSFITTIKQLYPLNQQNLSQILSIFESYQTKLLRLAKFSPSVLIDQPCASIEELSFLILYAHMKQDNFNLHQSLNILSELTHCDRATLLSKCIGSKLFKDIASNYYFHALLQKDENNETILHQLLKEQPECLITIIEKAEKYRRAILLKQTDASGESVWQTCVLLYAPMPIFQRISATLTEAQKRALAPSPTIPPQLLTTQSLFRPAKKQRQQDAEILEPTPEKTNAKRRKISCAPHTIMGAQTI